MMRVFIGVDQRQLLAYSVARHSIEQTASKPVSITPLILRQLPLQRRGLTEFTFARYLVPWLCHYEGAALFLDADTLCMGDISALPWDTTHSVCVVPHDTVVKNGQQVSVRFERPSVMLFNCTKCKRLTPEYIERGKPQSFEWADSVGDLPREWNHLVGYDSPDAEVKLAHFTMGIPCFPETQNDDFAAEWQQTATTAFATCSWAEIMGGSVHAAYKQPPQTAAFLRAQGFR